LFCSVALFAGFLDCCFFFFCFFFTTFGLPESEEASSDVVLSQKSSRWHDRLCGAFVGFMTLAFVTLTQVEATVPTPRNFLRGSSLRDRCRGFGVADEAANSFNESASIVRKEALASFVPLILELKFTARCQSILEFFFFDDLDPSARTTSFNWDAFSVTSCRFRRDFFRVFLTSSLPSS